MFAFYIAAAYYQLHFYVEAVINYKQLIRGIDLNNTTKTSKESLS